VLYPGPNPYQEAIREYHRFLDGLIGGLLEHADDDTRVLIVSDHGAKRMDGSIALNEWLIQQGYLVLKSYPAASTRFAKLEVDWTRTRAWGEGGYYGRVFVNLQGREPAGIVEPAQYEAFRRELKAGLEAIPDDQGRPMQTRAELPEQIYPEVRNIAPDLFVFFGDLYWRAAGTVGHGTIHLQENDTGPDGANHDWRGIFAMAEGSELHNGAGRTEPREELRLLDVAPTVLHAFGLPVPARLQGRVVPGRGET
jgi:predicted AlkP superfamily phosphohydrolase/phosphomutase